MVDNLNATTEGDYYYYTRGGGRRKRQRYDRNTRIERERERKAEKIVKIKISFLNAQVAYSTCGPVVHDFFNRGESQPFQGGFLCELIA